MFYLSLINKNSSNEVKGALYSPISCAFLNCKNVHLHTTEEASAIERLIAELASNFKAITRIELYYISGRSPELLDRDLENMRTEGYLEYIFPTNQKILHENIEIIKNKVGENFVLRDDVKNLRTMKVIKQYEITDKGKALAKSGNKNSFEDGDLEFLFIRNKDIGIENVFHQSSELSWNYRPVDLTDFGFIEEFLKDYREDISDTKVFEELKSNSQVELYEPQNTELWLLLPEEKYILRTERKSIETISKNQIILGNYNFENEIRNYLQNQEFEFDQIREELPFNCPKGVSFALNISNTNDITKINYNLYEKISDDWCKVIKFEDEGFFVISKLVLVPLNKESFIELIITKIKEENEEGANKILSEWKNDISKKINSLEQITHYKCSVEEVLERLREEELFFIAEELVEEYIIKKYDHDLLKSKIIEKKGKIFAYITIRDTRFLNYFREYENFSTINRQEIAKNNHFKQKFTLNTISESIKNYYAVKLYLESKERILRYYEINKILEESFTGISSEFNVLEKPDSEKILDIIKNVLDKKIKIAEELVQQDLFNNKAIKVFSNIRIKKNKKPVIEVYSTAKNEILFQIIENKQIIDKDYNIIINKSTEMRTVEKIVYKIIVIANEKENAKNLAIVRIKEKINDKFVTKTEFLNRINSVVENILKDSNKLNEIDGESLKIEIIEVIRKKCQFTIIEELLTKEIEGKLKEKEYYKEIKFDFSKRDQPKVIIPLIISDENIIRNQKFLMENINDDSSEYEVIDQIGKIKYGVNVIPGNLDTYKLILNFKIRSYCYKTAITEKQLLKQINKIRKILDRTIKQYNVEISNLREITNKEIVDELRKDIIVTIEDGIRADIRKKTGLTDFIIVQEKNYFKVKLNLSQEEIIVILEKTPNLLIESNKIQLNFRESEIYYSTIINPKDKNGLKYLLLEKMNNIVNEKDIYSNELKSNFIDILNQYQQIKQLNLDRDKMFKDIISKLHSNGYIPIEDEILNKIEKELGIKKKKIEIKEKNNLLSFRVIVNRKDVERMLKDEKLENFLLNPNTKQNITRKTELEYIIKIKPENEKVAKIWNYSVISKKLEGKIVSYYEITTMFNEYYLKIFAEGKRTTQEEIIKTLKSNLKEKLMIKEEIIKKNIMMFYNNYPNVKVKENNIVIVSVNKKEFKNFKSIKPKNIKPEMNIESETLGNIRIKHSANDQDSFVGLLTLMAEDTIKSFQNIDIDKELKKYFKELIKNSKLDEKTKNKIKKMENSIIKQINEYVKLNN